MAVAVAEHPYAIEIHGSVDPHLRLVQAGGERTGGISGELDKKRLLDFLDAPIVLGVRQPEEFPARLTAVAGHDEASINAFADIAMRETNGSRAVVLRCYASALTLGLVTVLEPSNETALHGGVPLPILVWSLSPRLADATARADILDFLCTLHHKSQLRVINTASGLKVGALDGPAVPFDDELDRDWRFTNDVATLEEWADMPLPLPAEVPAEEVARIQQAAQFVRTRRVSVTFSGDISVVLPELATAGDETTVEIAQDFGVLVFGFDVPLGTGRANIPVRVVAASPDQIDPNTFHVTMHPLDRGSIDFELAPPPERLALKRTLLAGEQPETELKGEALWDNTWSTGEREAEQQLRTGQTVRFTTEDAFYDWLASGDSKSDE